jgi:hypothetical protein
MKAAILCSMGWFERKLIFCLWWLVCGICQFQGLFAYVLLSNQGSLCTYLFHMWD